MLWLLSQPEHPTPVLVRRAHTLTVHGETEPGDTAAACTALSQNSQLQCMFAEHTHSQNRERQRKANTAAASTALREKCNAQCLLQQSNAEQRVCGLRGVSPLTVV